MAEINFSFHFVLKWTGSDLLYFIFFLNLLLLADFD